MVRARTERSRCPRVQGRPVTHTDELLTATLRGYDIDPLNTPEVVELEYTRAGIIVDQFIPLSTTTGDVLMHEGDHGAAAGPVTVKRFFPHPATSTE